ncbi:MAG: NAD(P)-dependent oxidoreductase [Planctomycetota bacterium]
MDASQVQVVASHPLHAEVRAELEQAARVTAGRPDAHTDAFIAFMTDRVDEALLDACPRLRIVAGALKGGDNIDVEACTRRGVWVTVVPDLLTAPTAELAVALLLALSRHVLPGDAFMRSGDFEGWRPELYGAGLDGATVGIVGMGAVGRAVEQRLAGFGCRVRGHDPVDPASTPLPELLAMSDFVVLAAPLTPESLHLVDPFAMKRGARLVNIGRGSVVSEVRVAEALAADHLAGYAADVFELEDRSRPDAPHDIPAALLQDQARTVFTPHLGSAVATVRREIERAAARNVLAVLRGERPPGAVNEILD